MVQTLHAGPISGCHTHAGDGSCMALAVAQLSSVLSSLP